jgi:phosphohistidine phosphatase
MARSAHLLLLLRHAIAEQPTSERRDEERRLTAEGKRKLREVVAGMRALDLPVEAILTSPLRRTQETAAIVAEGYEHAPVEELAALAPGGDPDAVLKALARHRDRAAVVLVGHQPDLGELASVLLAGTPGLVPLPFKKAGLAGIVVATLPPRSAGILEFFFGPGHLRRIGRAGLE